MYHHLPAIIIQEKIIDNIDSNRYQKENLTWNVGVMEYWSNGKEKRKILFYFISPTTPPLQYSNYAGVPKTTQTIGLPNYFE
jgi:hypothetical protein